METSEDVFSTPGATMQRVEVRVSEAAVAEHLSRAHPSSLQASEEHKEEEGAHQVLSQGGWGACVQCK